MESNQQSRQLSANKNEIEDLLNERSGLIGVQAKILQLIEPKIFSLNLENISNVRNSLIIAATLATIGLLILNNQFNTLSIPGYALLFIPIIGFFIAIIFYSLYLKNNIEEGIIAYRKLIDDNVDTANKGVDNN